MILYLIVYTHEEGTSFEEHLDEMNKCQRGNLTLFR